MAGVFFASVLRWSERPTCFRALSEPHVSQFYRAFRPSKDERCVRSRRCLIVVPLYQNVHNLVFTILILVLYTIIMNKTYLPISMTPIEWILFVLSTGFFFDGLVKM
jgi:hypothetical protein